MRVMTIKEAVHFFNAPPPDGLGMKVTHAWVRKHAEPDADGRRALPFFQMNKGKTSKLMTTDEALVDHFRKLAEAAKAQ